MTEVSLNDVQEVYKKNLHIEEEDRIDIVLAVAISSKQKGIPIWMILIGPSGDMKSVQLESLMSWKNTMVLHGITSRTLVNGSKDKKNFPDLAPKLNKKLVVIPDMAQILELHPQEKGAIWAQLRDLFDGFAGKASGQGSNAKYKDLYVSFLIGSTPAIDSQILIHQNLGTRELCYRTQGNKDKQALMDKCFANLDRDAVIKRELKEITQAFIEQIDVREDIVLSEETINFIKKQSIYVCYMRAPGEYDSYTHDLRNKVYPEEPGRISKQLKRIYVCLMSLDKNYPNEKALRIIKHIARSSSNPLRVRIYDFLMEHVGQAFTTSSISRKLNVGKGSIKMQCLAMESMGILSCNRIDVANRFDIYEEHWTINREHELHKDILNPRGEED